MLKRRNKFSVSLLNEKALALRYENGIIVSFFSYIPNDNRYSEPLVRHEYFTGKIF